MAGTFDVAGRLAEGRPAVDDLARYASACQVLGTCGHGLTDRVERAYTSEAGLDLHALDADHAALRAAVTAVREAQELQDAQLDELDAAWTGAGADAAAEFLHRHSAASTQAVTALSTAAEQVGALREDLWRIVDAKVAAAEAVDARTAGVRREWRAAAETVTTGVGDRATASELVDAHVAPFVEQDVRAEWVAAMEAASAAIAQCFDTATTAVRSEGPPRFPEPAESWSPAPVPTAAPTVGATAPGPPPPATAPAPMTEPAAAAPMPAAPMPAAPLPTPGAPPDMGSGLSGLSGQSGVGGFGRQLGEMVSGLMPPLGEALGDVSDLDEPDDALEHDQDEDGDGDGDGDGDDEEERDEPQPEPEPEPEPESEPEPEPDPESGPEVPAVGEEPVDATADEPVTEPPAPTPPPAPAAPLAAPIAPPSGPASATPCEIAANEVPQVGE
ncbi:MAG: WXG100 family type VII secretion target [Actinomycetota bacterium]|nr:WXG100 family type VII secretion target [Actinomycetota bacterium]